MSKIAWRRELNKTPEMDALIVLTNDRQHPISLLFNVITSTVALVPRDEVTVRKATLKEYLCDIIKTRSSDAHYDTPFSHGI